MPADQLLCQPGSLMPGVEAGVVTLRIVIVTGNAIANPGLFSGIEQSVQKETGCCCK